MRVEIFSVVALALAVPETGGNDHLRLAWEAFSRGRELRRDPFAARRSFAEAAHHASQAPGGATVRRLEGHAALLAGDIAHAIAAYRRGLQKDPDDAGLRHGLTRARSLVAYSSAKDRQELIWNEPVNSRFRQVVRRWGIIIVALAATVACLALRRALVFRSKRYWATFGLATVWTFVVMGAWWWERHQRWSDAAGRFVVIQKTTTIYTGNHESFPPRRDDPVPVGVEARATNQIGEWLQIELADGSVGWVPVASVREVGAN